MAAGDSATIELDGHRLALTHLRKVLYPATGTTKSDVIAYFAEVAHAMIPHLADRPVTRKRWPDGVTTTPFFHKDLPKGTPSWVSRRIIQHSDGPKAYPVVDSPATLAWLGQIAALELHVPQWRFSGGTFDGGRFSGRTFGTDPGAPVEEAAFGAERPDRLVFDLDPGSGVGLAQCAEVARAVRKRLKGSAVVPVTSGSKGIHLYSRLDGSLTSDDASMLAREIAEAIEQDMPELVVSRMAKVLRAGKVFIDWSQNNGSKTTIAPYSLRGRDHPTVAAPRTWEELADPDLRHLLYTEVLALLAEAPDPMQGLESGDNDGAEHRKLPGATRKRSGRASQPAAASVASDADDPPPEPVDDKKLDKYRSMRSADRTPEPVPEPGFLPHGNDNTFVIQEHHARRLHYDFRLERGGVLVSWAVPKNIPPDTGQNRLAVQTEDHPLDYADFAGIIPPAEYGGGTVTIWDAGTYSTEKWRDDEVMIVLDGQRARGRYVLIRTKDNSWLMHRMKDQSPVGRWTPRDNQQEQVAEAKPAVRQHIPAPPMGLAPMLAAAGTVQNITDDAAWRYEGKWDGVRALATVGPDGLRLHSRAGNDFTHAYPELQELTELLGGHSGVLDGEIVALDEKGRTSFSRLQQRMNLAAARDVARVRQHVPVQFWLFDVLHLDGVSLLRKRYDDRRRILEALPLSGHVCQVRDQLTGTAREALQGSIDLNWEGIVAKRADSTYLPGKRSRSWIKIKNFHDLEVVIVGWKPGAGRREGSLGSLLLAVPDGSGGLRYAGKVGTGFTDVILDQLMAVLKPLQTRESAVSGTVPRAEAAGAVWVDPSLVGEVKFVEWTPDRRLRATSWRGLRPDRSVVDLPAPGPTAAR